MQHYCPAFLRNDNWHYVDIEPQRHGQMPVYKPKGRLVIQTPLKNKTKFKRSISRFKSTELSDMLFVSQSSKGTLMWPSFGVPCGSNLTTMSYPPIQLFFFFSI